MTTTDHATTQRQTSMNRRRADRRRSVLRTVQEQRERLNAGSGGPIAFDYELALTFAKTRISATYSVPLLIVLVAGASSPWSDPVVVVSWAIAVLTLHALVIVLCRRFRGLRAAPVNLRTWRNRFVAADFMSGLAWAALFAGLQFKQSSLGLDLFQFAVMLVMVAVTTSLASAIPLAGIAGTVPVTLTLIAVFMTRGGLLHLSLSLLAASALVFLILLSWRLYSATLAMLEHRAEKDLLIAELGTAKAISDESRRRAEAANLAKSRFLATMSHELRTPLNAILGFSQIIKNEVLGPIGNDSYKDYVGDIHDSGRHLLNLINEILDLSRIEAGRHELNEEPVDLAAVVADCHRLMQLKAKAKQITVRDDFDADLPRLWGDQRAIRQIVLNLLSNALKFTPSGGKIELKVQRTVDGGQYLAVTDNGPGIPEDEIPIVLSSFGQGSIAIDTAERGAGLGLSIVQALMTTHDGAFELTSKLRQGTKVVATFPRSRVMETLPSLQEEAAQGGLKRAG